ncbi:MAG: hypothetical protein ACOYJ2_01375 [Rickettsiales bacterium]
MQHSRAGFEPTTPSNPYEGMYRRLISFWKHNRAKRIEQVHHTIQQVLSAYVDQHDMEYQLDLSRKRLKQFEREQSCLNQLTGREVGAHYKQILAYAEYLEERIVARRADPVLRDDYDGVCEQALNLRLITEAIGLLEKEDTQRITEQVALSPFMHRIMLDIAGMLDRRAMKLNSTAWEESLEVTSNSAILRALVMLMMLATLRLAEDDSMLSLSTTSTNRTVCLYLRINLMRPGALTESERYAFLEQCMYGRSTHVSMFTSTLRQHANIELATLLSARIGATLCVEPVDSHACDVVLELPRS